MNNGSGSATLVSTFTLSYLAALATEGSSRICFTVGLLSAERTKRIHGYDPQEINLNKRLLNRRDRKNDMKKRMTKLLDSWENENPLSVMNKCLQKRHKKVPVLQRKRRVFYKKADENKRFDGLWIQIRIRLGSCTLIRIRGKKAASGSALKSKFKSLRSSTRSREGKWTLTMESWRRKMEPRRVCRQTSGRRF